MPGEQVNWVAVVAQLCRNSGKLKTPEKNGRPLYASFETIASLKRFLSCSSFATVAIKIERAGHR